VGEGNRRTRYIFIVDLIKDDPAFADVHPMRSHIALILSRGTISRRVYVGWKDEYIVAFIDPFMEFSERTTIGEDRVVGVVREYLARLELQIELEPLEAALKELESLLSVQIGQLSPDNFWP
jgi:hypothetical protein